VIDLAELPARLAEVRERIVAAAERAGRRPEEVTLVGVTKTHPAALVEAAWRAGLRVFGENRVQEALDKSEELAGRPEVAPEWHLIGPLQSNKVRAALGLFRTIHSVDRPKIAEAIHREATARGLRVDGFLEVNVGGEESKHGFSPEGFIDAVAPLARFHGTIEHNGSSGLCLVGLMAVPPFADDPEASRPWFVRLRELGQELAARPEWAGFPNLLSMGMSHDYAVAIEEGATHVRVGTALFGTRG
jgi:pyridoxal phosphate enzyme (YggS family)